MTEHPGTPVAQQTFDEWLANRGWLPESYEAIGARAGWDAALSAAPQSLNVAAQPEPVLSGQANMASPKPAPEPDVSPAAVATPPQAELPPSPCLFCGATDRASGLYRYGVGVRCNCGAGHHNINTWNARAALPQEPADDAERILASLADTVAEAIRNTCSMPHPKIGLDTDLRPYIWSLSYEANAQKKRADEREALAAPLDAQDAKRYLWIRNAGHTERCRLEHYASDALDKAIDAAMALSPSPSEKT